MVAKLSSVSTMVAASRATSVPERAHRDADVGAPQRGGVVDAVAGHRHDVAARRAARRRSAAWPPGEVRAKTISGSSASSRSSSASVSRVELGAGDDAAASAATMPTCAGDRRGGRPVVAGDHVIRMPARWQRATAAATSGRGGSSSATRPSSVRSGSASSRSAGMAVARRARGAATASTRRPCRGAVDLGPRRLRRRSRPAGAPRPSAASTRCTARSTASGAPLTCSRSAGPRLVDGRHPLQARVEGEQRTRWRRRGRRRRRTPRAAASCEQRELGRVPCPARRRRRRARGAARRSGDRRARGRASAPRRGAGGALAAGDPERLHRCIRFSVRVPVLSVQMTVVEPSVSTARGRLTSARRGRGRATPDRQGQGDRRQQALGDVGDEQADGEHRGVASEQPGDQHAERQERDAGGDRDDGDQPGDPPDLPLQRAALAPDAAGTGAAIRPSSVCIAGGGDHRACLAAGADGAAEHEVGRLQQRARRRRAASALARDRHRLAGQRGQSTSRPPVDQPRVGADPVALGDAPARRRAPARAASTDAAPGRRARPAPRGGR